VTQPARLRWRPTLSGFRINPELVGRRLSLGVHDGYRISLVFPKDVDDHLVTDGPWRPDAPAQVTHVRGGRAWVITIKQLTVRADFRTDLDYLAAVPADYQATTAEWSQVEELLVHATNTAERILRVFINLVAVSRRAYAATIEVPPTATYNMLEVGKPPNHVRFGKPAIHVTTTVGETGLNRLEARRLQRRVARGGTVPLGWEQYLEAHRRLVLAEDPRPALVEAVTAVEVGLKDALRRKGRKSKAAALLVDTDRLRDLMKEIADAVLGQSYAAADHANYDRLDSLIKQRQDLVHRAKAPVVADLKIQLPAVRALLEWLDNQAPW
jgi:hypothetical protein